MTRRGQVGFIAVICGLTFAAPAVGTTGNDACVSQINNDARKVLDARAKADRKCIKSQPGANVTTCINGSDATTTARQATLTSHFQDTCASPPAFGTPAGGATAINTAAANAATAITHDLFGASVTTGTGGVVQCQERVVRRAGALAVTMWKEFRACKKKGLAGYGSANALAAACLGGPGGTQADLKSKIGKSQSKLAGDIQKKCVGQVSGSVGSVFPGRCTGSADGQFAACAGQRVKCRFCEAVKTADGLPDGSLNCDLFDDGISNASCGPPFTPTPTMTPSRTPTRTRTPGTPLPTPTIPNFCDPDLSIPGLVQVPVTLQPGTMSCGGLGFDPPPLPPFSGQLNDGDGTKIQDLGLGCLYAGNLPPVTLPGGTARLGVVGVSLLPPSVTLAGSEGTGPNDCTLGAGPGKHCLNDSSGTDTMGACATDEDCGQAKACALDAHCFFGPPIPIVAGPLGTCVMNSFLTDLCGEAVLLPQSANFSTTLAAQVYLGDIDQPCPLCVSGTCNGGKNDGLPCTASGSAGTSSECPPRADQFFTTLTVPIPQLSTGVATLSGPDGRFCPAQTFAGAFAEPDARTIIQTGAALGSGSGLSMTLAGTFCIPSAGGIIDAIARLPAPGAIAVGGEIDLTAVLPLP